MNRLVLATLMVATIVLGTAASGAPARNDDVRLSSFQVVITFDRMAPAYFRSVSGLSVEIDVVEFREGDNGVIRKLPGRAKYPNIVLKQPFTGSASELLKWTLRIAAGTPEPKKGTIVLYDQKQQVVATYTITSAWPVKWEGPDFDASSNEVALETIEIAHEGLRLTDP